MNSRERIINALHHRSVDRVPIDLGGTRQSGIAVQAYAKLRKTLGRDGEQPIRVFDLFQQLAELGQDIADHFGSDTLPLNRPKVAFGIENKDWKPFRFFDGPDVLVPGGFRPETEPDGSLVLKRGDQVIAKMPADGFHFDRFEPYPGALHPDLATWEPPRIAESDWEHYHRESIALHEGTDKALVVAMGPPYELFNGMGQGGFENWMVTFATERDYVMELYAKLTDAWLENLEKLWNAVGDRVQVLQIADDFGTQTAPFLSIPMFRDKVLPAYKRGLDWVHENTPWKVLLHSDGAVFPLIPSLVEMGIDFLNPVQTSATGMDPQALMDAFHHEIGFWGGSCDSQGTLVSGTPEDVAEEVRRNLEIFKPLEGGFIFASVHNIQANVSPEHIVALFGTALAW